MKNDSNPDQRPNSGASRGKATSIDIGAGLNLSPEHFERVSRTYSSVFESVAAFQAAREFARVMMASSFVLPEYRDSLQNCMAAIDIAQAMGVSAFAVAMNLRLQHDRAPSWYTPFLIGRFNQSGAYASRLKYDFTGAGEDLTCVAWALDHAGLVDRGPSISVRQARELKLFEGDAPHNAQQLLMYRAAAYFIRLYCPEISFGTAGGEPSFEDLPGLVSGPKSSTPPATPTHTAGAERESARDRFVPAYSCASPSMTSSAQRRTAGSQTVEPGANDPSSDAGDVQSEPPRFVLLTSEAAPESEESRSEVDLRIYKQGIEDDRRDTELLKRLMPSSDLQHQIDF